MRHVRQHARIDRATMPVSVSEEEAFGINPSTRFEWHRPARVTLVGVKPPGLSATPVADIVRVVPGRSVMARGRWNNADVYMTIPAEWLDPTLESTFGAQVVASLLVDVDGSTYPIDGLYRIPVADLGGANPVINSDGSRRVFAFSVRARPCDGFRLAVDLAQNNHGSATAALDLPEGQAWIWAWGEEAGESGTGTPTPPTLVVEQLSKAPKDFNGNSTTALAQLTATPTPTVQGVQLTAFYTNTDQILVGYSSSTMSQFLNPGDSILIPVADASLIWIRANSGTQSWVASVYS